MFDLFNTLAKLPHSNNLVTLNQVIRQTSDGKELMILCRYQKDYGDLTIGQLKLRFLMKDSCI